jgi:hypothetical protein
MTVAYNQILRTIHGSVALRPVDFPARSLGIGPEVNRDAIESPPDPRRAQTSVKVNVADVLADGLSASYEGQPGRGPVTPKQADVTGQPWYGPEVGY